MYYSTTSISSKGMVVNSTIEEPVQVYNEEYDIIDDGSEDIQDD